MKKTNTIYWIFTALLCVGMLFASVPSLFLRAQAETFFATLGFPGYMITFLDIAKILGVIAILIPGYPRIKEWAYAGLAFDLIGATYAQMAKSLPPAGLAFMLVYFVILFGSYFYYHKKLKASAAQ